MTVQWSAITPSHPLHLSDSSLHYEEV
jgi:hypothetical protein